MDWIFDHLKLVLMLGFLFISWLAQRRQKSAEASRPTQTTRRASETTRPLQAPATAVEEQVRRIQEEIRRKIQERAAGEGTDRATPPAIPPAKARAVPSQSASSKLPKSVLPLPQAAQPVLSVESRKREEMRQEEERRQEDRNAERVAAETSKGVPGANMERNDPWTAELRDPAALRRAVVLREVLGPPVSMRR